MIDACIFQSICWIVSIVVAPLGYDNVGYQEKQSGAALSFSETCFIQNQYINNLPLKANRRVFFYPNINITLQDSNSNISAKVSPSTG